jgi:hypothetical protein
MTYQRWSPDSGAQAATTGSPSASTSIGCSSPCGSCVVGPPSPRYMVAPCSSSTHQGALAGRVSSRSAKSRSAGSRSAAMRGRLPAGRRRPATLVYSEPRSTEVSMLDSGWRGQSSLTSPAMATTRAISPRRAVPARNRWSSAPWLWKTFGSRATGQSLVSIPNQRGSTPSCCHASPAGTRIGRCLVRGSACNSSCRSRSEPGSRWPTCTGTRPEVGELTLATVVPGAAGTAELTGSLIAQIVAARRSPRRARRSHTGGWSGLGFPSPRGAAAPPASPVGAPASTSTPRSPRSDRLAAISAWSVQAHRQHYLTCANLVRCCRLDIVARRADALEVLRAAVRRCTIWTTLASGGVHLVRTRDATRTA